MGDRGALSSILLAGGRCRRMGRDKASLTIGGRSLLEIAMDRARRIASEVIVASGRSAAPPVASGRIAALPVASVRWTPDIEPDLGPLMGLFSGLLACRGSRALVLAVDVPFLPTGLLAAMARASVSRDHVAVLARWNGRIEPPCAIYHKSVLPVLEGCLARGERSFEEFLGLRSIRTLYLDESFLAPWGNPALLFHNINTPADHVHAQRLYLRAHSSTAVGPRRWAARVALETAPPPVFGKEIPDACRSIRAGHRLPARLAYGSM